jgi:hypothetical protein
MAEIMDKAKEKLDEWTDEEPQEGGFTKRVERQTAKIPSMVFLNLGIGSMLASAALAVSGERYRKLANFIGLWVPTILILGVYNKLVKLEGSDRTE